MWRTWRANDFWCQDVVQFLTFLASGRFQGGRSTSKGRTIAVSIATKREGEGVVRAMGVWIVLLGTCIALDCAILTIIKLGVRDWAKTILDIHARSARRLGHFGDP